MLLKHLCKSIHTACAGERLGEENIETSIREAVLLQTGEGVAEEDVDVQINADTNTAEITIQLGTDGDLASTMRDLRTG